MSDYTEHLISMAGGGGDEHHPTLVLIADGTRDVYVCAKCGVRRGGFVVAGQWPCQEATCACGHLKDVHFQDGCVAKSGGVYGCECLDFEDGLIL